MAAFFNLDPLFKNHFPIGQFLIALINVSQKSYIQ